MIVAAVGVVFTTWFNARGADTVDRIGGEPPVEVGHVAVEYADRDTALRRPVTDPADRAALLGSASGTRRETMLTRHDWAPLETADVTVVLVGNRSSLRIVDIQPRVLAREPVWDGALLVHTPAGEAETIELAADLDRPAPRFTTAKNPDVPYFRKKQIDLKRDERVTLSMTVVGRAASYTFDLAVTVLAGDRTEQVTVRGPGGVPFRVTGTSGTYRSYYTFSPLGGWQPISRSEACSIEEKLAKAGKC
ncbi:hypothetical protein [Nonomuraea gerenzanensis]|uniref:Uncharacterized protein n=1 Tax=Nonomuraea gerenzanensis TaxID=93944 RepID=A0A1M4ED18_9ACTN|nr:hypothetical protein [Nonomuraea gerenzanensis]UBU08519.1 hypothetical protein LCN96_29450 [Nonomuraea gerenzanensis]SBO96867.1 hypothetical protein BN4615_P6383 [Nonomuraea gerenzanensis]